MSAFLENVPDYSKDLPLSAGEKRRERRKFGWWLGIRLLTAIAGISLGLWLFFGEYALRCLVVMAGFLVLAWIVMGLGILAERKGI